MIATISAKFCHMEEYTLEDVKKYANRELTKNDFSAMSVSAYTELVALAYIYTLYYQGDEDVTIHDLIEDAETDVEESAPQTLMIHVDEDYVEYWNDQIDLHNNCAKSAKKG